MNTDIQTLTIEHIGDVINFGNSSKVNIVFADYTFERTPQIYHSKEFNKDGKRWKDVLLADGLLDKKAKKPQYINSVIYSPSKSLLDWIEVGIEVNVMFKLTGSKSEKDGIVKYYTNIVVENIYKIK